MTPRPPLHITDASTAPERPGSGAPRRRLRAGALAIALLTSIALSGCGQRAVADAGAAVTAGTCVPRYPTASDDRLRAGRPVTITVSAGACTASFERRDRRLALTWVDSAGHRTRVGSVRAQVSGAFEREIRIPEGSPAGTGVLLVTGVDVPCPTDALCAAYGAALSVVDTQPDFATPTTANGVADDLAAALHRALKDDPSWMEVAIVTDGLEVWLHAEDQAAARARVERAFATVQAGYTGDRAIADAARLQVQFDRHSRSELSALKRRIEHDRTGWLARHGIRLTGWAVDPRADGVVLLLRRYSDSDARRLSARYGEALVVRPVSVVAVAA